MSRDLEDLALKPCVPSYGPCNVRDVQVGQIKLWCRCGLSKKQPWCDGSHQGTSFTPLKWIVPGTKKDGRAQTLYSICNCKYTKDPPYCDATHNDLPLKYLQAQKECTQNHATVERLCTNCGYCPLTRT